MRPPPPLIALAAGLAQRRLAPSKEPSPGRAIGAAAVAGGSLSLVGGAGFRFHRSETTTDPFKPERATTLVTGGPNGITRNPMYVGMAGLLVANAIRRGSWLAMLPVAAFVAFIDRVQIPPEEAALRNLFGEEYDEYRASVPRWLPTPTTLRGR